MLSRCCACALVHIMEMCELSPCAYSTYSRINNSILTNDMENHNQFVRSKRVTVDVIGHSVRPAKNA